MQLDAERYRLDADQHRKIFERFIKPHLFAGITPAQSPSAVVFGGQPGAGKSAAMAAALHELGGPGAAVPIVGDDLRPYHPKFAQLLQQDDRLAAFYTDRDSGAWVEMAIDYAARLRVPVAIEGTMRNADKVAQTLQQLRQAGYRTEARALAVPHALSWQAVLTRYETQRLERGRGRLTTPEAHQAGYDGLPVTLERIERERLADRVSVYRRDGKRLYWHEVATGIKSEQTTARKALEAFRSAPLSLGDHRMYAADYARLEAMLSQPGRAASGDELQRVSELRRGAQLGLMAEAFRSLPQHQAAAEFPELRGAYEALAALGRAMKTPAGPEGRAVAIREAKQQLAKRIEAGQLPAIRPAAPVQTLKAGIPGRAR